MEAMFVFLSEVSRAMLAYWLAAKKGARQSMTSQDLDQLIEATVLALLSERSPEASVCPSEVARALFPQDEEAWRAAMPRVRAVAVVLARRGRLRITRKGVTLAPEQLGSGPIRLRRGDVP